MPTRPPASCSGVKPPDPATYIGRGKAEELRRISEAVDADTVVFDDELTPAQQRNLEKILGRTAIDRTAVILDIFAQNAHTQEGRAQVELALSRYRLPRLRGKGLALSQQAGGIGTRGPGETQLEVDRRRIMRRIRKLEVELRDLEATRRTQRKARKRGALRTVSLVGYTNAGKSTPAQCLHRCRRARRGPALLHPRPADATPRAARRRGGALLGHGRFRAQAAPPARGRLPRHLGGSRRPPICSCTSSTPPPPTRTARSTPCAPCWPRSGRARSPSCLAFNKADLDRRKAGRLMAAHPGSVACSALTGRGVPELLRAIADRLRLADRTVELAVPVARGDVVAAIHREGEVVGERYEGEHVLVQGAPRRARGPAIRRVRPE